MRIVSLLPSATEILFAIGAGDDVVGVTFECDHPPQARERRIVSTSALPPGLDAAGIDAVVRQRLAAGEDLYHLDSGALRGLDAELVVTQDLCAVCAVDVSEVHDALDHLGCTAEVLTTDPHTLDEVLDSVVAVGRATGHEDRARTLIAELTERLDRVSGSARPPAVGLAGQHAAPPARPRVVLLEWTDPPFAPGHWVPEMVQAAGGHSVLGTAGQQSRQTTWAEIAAARPEIIVSAPCGFGLTEAARLTGELLDGGPIARLQAEGGLPDDIPVWAVDANASFARPGPRLVDGVEAMAAILHPQTLGAPAPGMATRLR